MYSQLLLTVKFQHLAFLEITLDVVVDMDRANAYGSAGKDEVARLEGKLAADVSHDVVNGKEHVARVPLLHRLTIDIKVEAQGLDIEKTLLAHPVANGGRTVEALAQFPGLAGCPETLLDIAGRKVNTHGNRIIIAVGKAFRNGLTQTADTHHQLGLVVYAAHEVGHKEWLVSLQEGRVGLGEYHRFLWSI